jgi:Fe-S-cluster containining protein
MSECDTCPKPGACCRDFPISNGFLTDDHPTLLHAMVSAAQAVYMPPEYADHVLTLPSTPWEGRVMIGLPFIPHERDTARGYFFWHCVNLLPNGRCGDYENRPYGPCVMFKPGEGSICAIHPDFGR